MRQITDAVIGRHFKGGQQLRLLDAGCGTGFNIRHFSSIDSNEAFGLDLSADAIGGVVRRGFTTACQASVTDIPFAGSSFDLVVTFDVLCQVEASPMRQAVREIHRVLKPGGFLFVRVPAYQWMRSSHDLAVHTKRRFTRPQLTGEIANAKFEIVSSSYANCLLFPLVIVRRTLKSLGIGEGSDVRPMPSGLAWMDPLFRSVLETEARLFRAGMKLPFGLSVICLARKPPGGPVD